MGGGTLSGREGKELCSPPILIYRVRRAGAAGYGAAAFRFLLPDNADTWVKGRTGDRSRNARLLDATSTPIPHLVSCFFFFNHFDAMKSAFIPTKRISTIKSSFSKRSCGQSELLPLNEAPILENQMPEK